MLDRNWAISLAEDLLEATGLERLQTVKPKRDSRFREEVLRAYGYRRTVCGFDVEVGDRFGLRVHPT
jgi:putative restriction endonuclease